MRALEKWLSWKGNMVKIRYHPDGVHPLSTKSEWTAELSAPLGSYAGSRGSTVIEALNDLNAELSKRCKSK